MKAFLSYPSAQIADPCITGANMLSARITGTSPSWLLQVPPFKDKYLRLTMKVEPDNIDKGKYYYCKLYFQEQGMDAFDEEHTLTLPIRSFDQFHQYTFKCIPFQRKMITQLRLDPINHPGTISISECCLRDYREDEHAMTKDLRYVLLNYYSRSGSTLTMKALTTHPQIAGYREGTHDAHVLNYFLKFYYLLKTSHSYESGKGDMFLSRLDSLLAWNKPEIFLPRPVEFSTYLHLNTLQKHYGQFLRGYIPRVLTEMDLDNAVTADYYIEKNCHHEPDTFDALLDLFPSSKVLAVFRDPRDVFLSSISFRKREKIIDLVRKSPEGQIDHVMESYRTRLGWIERIGAAGFIFRYEDLFKNSKNTMRSILEFLQIDASEPILNRLVHVLHGNDLQAERHITAESADASIGRWKQELSPDHAAHFRKYAELFEKLGYVL